MPDAGMFQTRLMELNSILRFMAGFDAECLVLLNQRKGESCDLIVVRPDKKVLIISLKKAIISQRGRHLRQVLSGFPKIYSSQYYSAF